MNKEEAIDIVDNKIWSLMNTVCGNCIIEDYERDNYQEAIETLLNLIQEQEKEFSTLNKQLQKKDKIIDEMTEYLASIDFDEQCVEVPGICMGCPKEDDLDGYMQCIKQYFERKVENG